MDDYLELYPKLAEKATEWAAREGLSDKFAYGALNAMWYTIVGDLRQRDYASDVDLLPLGTR